MPRLLNIHKFCANVIRVL